MRTILISGASSGIGLKIAYKQLKEGNRVSVGIRDLKSLKEIVNAMWIMFIKAPWSVKKGLMIMRGRELKMFFKIIFPNI